ncbi:N-acetylglucosamine kinase [Bacillus sp. es.036]|uniref:N-acetylglucosamine kinase n=1 Tax=Bacillus sp. es.036 TaxID=1761764 RepID=UPI000BFA86B9|nr:BadF/BadG/BcrA/BcrD ATPase family protein [Bacillus sp. es.036]PFG14927.1 N-acetylglucosamine kinase-like BadF-type ATPase [Bacillus sp. es.036]
MPLNKKVYMGIDGGGTKTVGLICNQDGVILSKSIVGSTNVKSRPEVEVRAAIHQVTTELMSGVKEGELCSVFVSTAGGDREEDQLRWKKWVLEVLSGYEGVLEVRNDAYGALASGTFSMEGTVLIAGTGSIAYALDRVDSRRVGGWGYLFGDEGSGYDIGQHALRTVAMMHDGRAIIDKAFCDGLLSFLKLTSAPDMITAIYEDPYARMKIASVAEVVIDLAEKQNPTALGLIQHAYRKLSELIDAIEVRSGRLVICGGLMESSFFRDGFLEEVRKLGVNNVFFPTLSPAVGACICALIVNGEPITKERKANLLSSYHVMSG